MKKIALSFIPLMLAGFFIPGENCGNAIPQEIKIDGPYVVYKNDQLSINYIVDDRGTRSVKTESMPISQRATAVLNVPTGEGENSFSVKLKDSLMNEAAEFPAPEKMFILSDIEGNFTAFKKLLTVGGVIDSAFNWTFGNGHLVLTGDFVDRGTQVMEVLWLIYMLEDKAKSAGGYVHYILGNHEIMNLSGDLRYLQPKYLTTAALMKQGYTSLIGDQTEIGRWLRTKNVVEKIGDILFMHGGFSRNVNHMALTLSTINALARPYYSDSTYKYPDPRVDTLYSDAGPFWYRGYYQNDKAIEKGVIDTTLSIYNVNKIATGHTIVADTVSILYNGKVLNSDVHHAKGHSEAFLIENGKVSRVLATGEKFEM